MHPYWCAAMIPLTQIIPVRTNMFHFHSYILHALISACDTVNSCCEDWQSLDGGWYQVTQQQRKHVPC